MPAITYPIDTEAPAPALPAIDQLNHLIRGRRSVFPQHFSGEVVPREQVEMILENAHWAPTHGRTEPWFFHVYSGEGLAQFGELHAKLYKQHAPADQFSEVKYETLRTKPTHCSHLIVLCMKRGSNEKIPVIEEIESVACAVQNMALTVAALGLGGYWGSGGMTYHPALRDALGLGPDDQVLGLFHLGVPKAAPAQGLRKTPWTEHVAWHE
ncbi:MAG: nitroreductase [Bacteroidetes bacterium]|nr:MAG: nitroreductase [Bacteroidota bacterium]